MRKIIILILVLLFLINFTSAAIIDSIISYWKLDESSGNAIDTESANDLVATGIAYGNAGIINDAFTFAGADTLEKASPTGLTSTDVSFSGWVYLTSRDNLDTIFFLEDVTPTTYFQIFLRDPALIEIHIQDVGGSSSFTTDFTAYMNKWTHIYAEFTATNTKLYLDNVLKIDEAKTYSRFAGVDLMGVGSGDGSSRPINGKIDEAGMWSRVLTTDEITELYNSGNALAYPFAPVDTCTCAGAGNNWEINMSDYCNITDACDLTTGTLTFTGAGITRINATVSTTNLGDPGANGILRILSNALILVS